MYAAQASAQPQWKGDERIVLGIDIGTTHSAVAYTYLYQGGPQSVKRVAKWPGQANQRHESKIPSVVWYDQHGRAQAFCAEAMSAAIRARAEREGWYLAEHFKLHVHPSSMASIYNPDLAPLPPGVTVERIYSDLLSYLYRHSRTFFEEREFEIAGGGQIWHQMASRDCIYFVLCHPCGWGLAEQNMLRHAAMNAGLVPSLVVARERVQFVSEAEASVHFVSFYANLESRLTPGVDFAVCDAGGSTVDTTLYTVSATTPSLALREKRDSACIQAGGIFVDKSASDFFIKKLYDGGLNPDQVKEYLETATQKFITEVKPSFENPTESHLIAIADRSITRPEANIERGYMTLTGADIEDFFEIWVDQIIASIQSQISNHPVQAIILVGGFGESPYLRARLRSAPGLRHIPLTVPDQSGAKAASEGSVLWVTRKSVVARATRFGFGTKVVSPCDANTALSHGRPLLHLLNGTAVVAGRWSEIVKKGHVVEDGQEISLPYYRLYDSPNPNATEQDTVYMYDQNFGSAGASPHWVLDPLGTLIPGFQELCTVQVDLKQMRGGMQKKKRKTRSCFEPSQSYWQLDYRIAFRFGTTELKAFAVWEERGVERRGSASIVPFNRVVQTTG